MEVIDHHLMLMNQDLVGLSRGHSCLAEVGCSSRAPKIRFERVVKPRLRGGAYLERVSKILALHSSSRQRP